MAKPIEIVVGRGQQFDPAANDTAYNNPNLAGQDVWIELYGSGPFPYENYEVLSSGGFQFLGGFEFGADGQTWFIHAVAYAPSVSPLQGITNGFNVNKVLTAMQGRLGWEQPTLAGMPTLSIPNLTATSGRTYEEFHPSASIQKLYTSQEDPQITDLQFNALLQKKDRTVIFRCLNAIFNKPQQIEHGLVYERQSNVRNIPVPNQGNFCGYRIKVSNSDYAVMINTVALFFNGVATFNLYLFNDLTLAPLKVQSVTSVANSQMIVRLDWILKYIDDNKGGLFYIGYFQNDLGSVLAVDEQLNLWDDSKCFGAWPFQSPQTDTLNFNRINPSVVFRTYGMNMEVSSYRDYTEMIVMNAHLFDEARGLLMAIYILEIIKNSSRTDRDNRQANQMIKLDYDLDLAFPTKEAPFMAGLRAQLKREYQRINDNFWPKAQAQIVSIAGNYSLDEFAYDSFDIKNLPPRERFY